VRLPVRRVRRTERLFSLLAVLVAIALIVPAVMLARPAAPAPVTIQILNVSDWHGNVDPVGGVGGAWNLSARWDQDRQQYPTLTLTAGDDIGATPPISSFFDEVPSILAQRMMGIQVNTLGNHNFDRGVAHLQRMIDLAGAPTSASAPGKPFKYVSANVKLNGDLKGVDPVAYFDVGGATVAVIGITNEEAPELVLPGSFGKVRITDGVEAANRVAKQARARADAVIVITHKGVRNIVNGEPVGELIDFANALQPGLVDVVVGDHTDIQYSGTHNGILVHENRSFGLTYAKTMLSIQPGVGQGSKAGRVLSKSVEFVTPGPAGSLSAGDTSCGDLVYCDQAIVDMLAPYRTQLAALLDSKIGTTTQPYRRGNNIERLQEVPLGNLIADGMRWRYGTQLAFMNGGGIRQQLPTCSYGPADTSLKRSQWDPATLTSIETCGGYASGAPYDIVLGDTFAVLNFANILNTRTVTGEQVWLALEHGVRSMPGANGRFPQISGFKFGFRDDIPSGCTGATTCSVSRVQWVTLSDGTPIPNSSSATYTMALPNFVNFGGDGYYMFNDGSGATQEIDWIVLAEYIKAFPALDPTTDTLNRITKCSGACTAP
jgi:2',3'-cyclic-nucleotide 2'-phosphodiesterase (5'-nucleotidase family)